MNFRSLVRTEGLAFLARSDKVNRLSILTLTIMKRNTLAAEAIEHSHCYVRTVPFSS